MQDTPFAAIAPLRPGRRRLALPDALVHEIRYRAIVLGDKHEAIAVELGVARNTVTQLASGARRASLAPDRRLLEWLQRQGPTREQSALPG